jgi:NADP-reducing hydrogenase subunit HndB
MAKLTVEALRALRAKQRQVMAERSSAPKAPQITVGMGTCGIAAGAKETLGAIVEELAAKGMKDVLVRQSGCMGVCYAEPTVEVVVPDMPVVIYGDVDKATARHIVEDHLVNRRLLDKRICGKPAVDII